MEHTQILPIDTVRGVVIWRGVAYDISVASSLLVMNVIDWARSLRERYDNEIEECKIESLDYSDIEKALNEITSWLADFKQQVLSHPGFLRRQSIDLTVVNNDNFDEYIEILLSVAFKVDIICSELKCNCAEYQFVLVADGEKRLFGTRKMRVPIRYTGNIADGILVETDQIPLRAQAAYRRWVGASEVREEIKVC